MINLRDVADIHVSDLEMAERFDMGHEDRISALYDDVSKIRDGLMKAMSTIIELQKEIKALKESTKKEE